MTEKIIAEGLIEKLNEIQNIYNPTNQEFKISAQHWWGGIIQIKLIKYDSEELFIDSVIHFKNDDKESREENWELSYKEFNNKLMYLLLRSNILLDSIKTINALV